MSSASQACVFCTKECKSSDSRPYPSSKSRDRIHNRCYIKKSLADKQAKPSGTTEIDHRTPIIETRFTTNLNTPSLELLEKIQDDNDKLKASTQAKKLNSMIESHERQAQVDRKKSSFFFDIKAGIAKSHEKRRFLNHRKICEMAPRYDDHGFKEDAVGRSYDHTGKDINTSGDNDSNSDSDKFDNPTPKIRHDKAKRKFDQCDPCDGCATCKKRADRVDFSEDSCWFCLSSPNVEKHLIVAIGTHCYITLAKGGLTDEHLLLIPIEHIASAAAKENSIELLAEKEKFIEQIVRYFNTKSMGVVLFERNFRSAHWQIQAVPVAKKILRGIDKRIKEMSVVHYTKCKYVDFASSLGIEDIIQPGSPYLHWRIEPNNINFACVIDVRGSFFPVQLPRIILANILECPNKIDWKTCCRNRNEYLELVAGIKDKWTKFSPN